MGARYASLILPCRRLEDFPTHLSGQAAAELLHAWTSTWHPAFIAATGRLPGWHPAEDPPDPATLDGEVVLVPSISRLRLPGDWCDRLRAVTPVKALLVEVAVSRDATLAAALSAAGIGAQRVSDSIVRDFLALGYAHLQVQLLTNAMHYATVLDAEQFTGAVVAAAQAALQRDDDNAREELGRAFDLLMDARNHVYSVDYYICDITLLAGSTLGASLRAKLASGFPTSLLATGDLLEQLAAEHPDSLTELRRAVEAGTACIVGGSMDGRPPAARSPESILVDLLAGRDIAKRHVGCELSVYGQFSSAFSPLLPEILASCGFRAALHTAFDGGPFPRAGQRKIRWGPHDGLKIDTLSATPLDGSRPETWLKLAGQVADSIAHDHVATIVLAGWPGQSGEYADDLSRIAVYGSVLGKPVTLEEYFRVTREVEDWSSFHPTEYSSPPPQRANAISSRVDEYRGDVKSAYQRSADGLAAIASPNSATAFAAGCRAAINAWNFPCTSLEGFAAIGGFPSNADNVCWTPDVPGCGYALVDRNSPLAPPVPLAEGMTLRNEHLELVIHEVSGGIQSLKTYGGRRTRLSQRLVMHDERTARCLADVVHDQLAGAPRLETQMLADEVAVTQSDYLIGEMTSRGRIVDAGGDLLARFTQTVRLIRGLPAALVDVELDIARLPDGNAFDSYFASRIAWSGDALEVRRGLEWVARPTSRKRIESTEWVEINDGDGTVTCFALGLPLHRMASPSWLDTLLVVEGEERRRFQFALGVDCEFPAQTALALATCTDARSISLPSPPASPRGWFLHLGARNTIITHVAPLSDGRAGVCVRILETDGRSTRTRFAAYRPFTAALSSDFLGQPSGLLSVIDGRVQLDLSPHGWLQLEAEW